MSETWRLACDQLLSRRCWKDECVVFNPLSGRTHLLTEVASEVLAAFTGSEGLSREALCVQLRSEFEIPGELDLDGVIGGLLGELDELGLIAAVRQ